MKSQHKGFSILEMIVVLGLVGIILGIVALKSGGFSEQRKRETVKGDLRAIQTAMNSYFLRHNYAYPDGSDWMSTDLVEDNPRILRQILYDPFRAANTQYSYFKSTDGKYYVVFSYGPDAAVDVTGINTSGKLTGASDDDIFVTNGDGTFS